MTIDRNIFDPDDDFGPWNFMRDTLGRIIYDPADSAIILPGDQLDSDKWDTTNSDSGEEPVILNETLRCAVSGGGASANNSDAFSVYQLSGNIDAQIDISVVTAPTNTGGAIVFQMSSVDDATDRVHIRYRKDSSSTQLRSEIFVNGAGYEITNTTWSDNFTKLKLIRSSGIWETWYYNSATPAWVRHKQFSSYADLDNSHAMIIELKATCWDNFPATSGDFDNFLVNSAGGLYHPYFVGATDGGLGGDSASATGTFNHSLSDGSLGGDSAYGAGIFNHSVSDGNTGGESVSASTTMFLNAADGGTGGDSASVVKWLYESVMDGCLGGEALVDKHYYNRKIGTKFRIKTPKAAFSALAPEAHFKLKTPRAIFSTQ